MCVFVLASEEQRHLGAVHGNITLTTLLLAVEWKTNNLAQTVYGEKYWNTFYLSLVTDFAFDGAFVPPNESH